jgi:type II secretory pathway pseudopilin PulG
MQGERGASLILAIAFMVVIGAISAAVISTATSGLQDRAALDKARDREYAADGAIETMIAAARGGGGVCPNQPTTPSTSPFKLNNINIHVDCALAPAVIVGPGGVLLTQNNLAFAACLDSSGQPCTAATNIITAQVNFQGAAPSKSFVQAWSVNR